VGLHRLWQVLTRGAGALKCHWVTEGAQALHHLRSIKSIQVLWENLLFMLIWSHVCESAGVRAVIVQSMASPGHDLLAMQTPRKDIPVKEMGQVTGNEGEGWEAGRLREGMEAACALFSTRWLRCVGQRSKV